MVLKLLTSVKNNTMTVKIYRWTATFLAMGCLVCFVCTMDSHTVCHEVVRNSETRLIPYQKTYTETCWLFFTCLKSHTSYINESYTMYRLEKTCCDGFKNVNGTCTDSSNCKKPFTCDCTKKNFNKPEECLQTCRNCYKDEKTESRYQKWCQNRKTCTCMDGYVSNGTACLPECKQGCVNGICKSPNNCSCYCGWNGPSCQEALVCLVASPVPVTNRTINPSVVEMPAIQTNTCTGSISYAIETLPACRQTCPEELCRNAAYYIPTPTTHGLTYYVTSIYTNCSTTESDETFLEKYNKGIAAGLLGILASLAIIGIFYFANIVKQKRRSKSRLNDKIVQYTSNEFLEDNHTYATITTED